MVVNIKCFVAGCNNPVIGQCSGYQGNCWQFYCRTHAIGKLCSECGGREASEISRRQKEHDKIEKHGMITATGTVSIFIVLDMKRFISEEDQYQFDSQRGNQDVARTLQYTWPGEQRKKKGFTPGLDRLKSGQELFVPLDDVPLCKYGLSRELVTFYTGIFEWGMAKEYPLYRVEKDHPSNGRLKAYLSECIQNILDDWNIYIHPTPRGLFVVRLSRHYTKERLSKIADNVQALQEPSRGDSSSNVSEEKQAQKTVQQQLAKEVCYHFVQNIADLGEDSQTNSLLNLTCSNSDKQEASDEDNLYNFYVVYYFEELFDETGSPISGRAIRNSLSLQEDLALLIEGILLEAEGDKSKVPDYRQTYLDEILAQDKSTWEDERYILTPRTAIIIPSQGTRNSKLRPIQLPATEQFVELVYGDYCRALERMLEFIVEVRFLAQVLERESWKACKEAVDWVQKAREKLPEDKQYPVNEGQIKLIKLSQWIASLNQLLSDCQEWSIAQIWSRAEYAEKKAEHLLTQMGVPLLLADAERNINNTNPLIDHMDNMLLTKLSEYGTQQTSRISTILSAGTLALVLFSLPQFLWYMHDRTLWVIHGKAGFMNLVLRAFIKLLHPNDIQYKENFMDTVIKYITNAYVPIYDWMFYFGAVIGPALFFYSLYKIVCAIYLWYKDKKDRKIAIKKIKEARISIISTHKS